MRFTRHRGKVRAELDQIESQLLQQLAEEVLGLVAEPEVSDDPLAAMVGMSGVHVHAPEDPVVARLLPAAYRDDEEAATEFRRYTDADLRTRKRADAKAVIASLPVGGGKIDLDRNACDHWLTHLNDVRLALGTILEVTEDLDDVPQDDPRWESLQVYGWLGWLQESLLSCVEPRRDGS